MDKVLKQRLIGASILIALAVIFIPMLFDAPDDDRGSREMSIELPEPPSDRAQVRRLPLDPDQARRVPQESVAEPESGPTEPVEPEPGREAVVLEVEPLQEREIDEEILLLPDTPEREVAEIPPAPAQPEVEPEVEPAPAPVAEPATPGERIEGWLVQVASFGSETTADEIVERLTGLGHVAVIDPLVRGGSTLYRVVTGPYPESADAERARGQIARTVAGVDPVVRSGSVPAATSPASGEQLAVQLGSFASQNNADRLVAQLRGLGFPAFIHQDTSGGRTIWRVRMGPYGSRAAAEAALADVAERAGLEGLVVSHP